MMRRLFTALCAAVLVLACGSQGAPIDDSTDASRSHVVGAVPTPVFPNAVDPPIAQDANFRIDRTYVSYVDGRIRAIEGVVIDQGAAGTNDLLSTTVALPNANTAFSNTQWSFGTLILQGTLTATRTVTAPTSIVTAPRKAIVNETAQSVVLAPAAGGTSVTVPSSSTVWVVFDGSSFSLSGGASGGGNATSIQGVPVSATAPTTAGQVLRYDGVSTYQIAQLSEDDILPAFTPTLSFASGGSSPIEIGTQVSPTFTGSPLPNGTGVTAYTISDNQGGGPTSRLGSGTGFQGPSVSYTITAVGTLSFTATVTKSGVTKTTSAASIAVDSRFFCFADTHSDGDNAITASSTTATLRHSTTSYSTSLASTLIGSSAVGATCSSTAYSSQYWYGLFIHTTTAHTFVDANTTFSFSASRVATFSFTNGATPGTATSYDLYRSDFLLNASFAPKVAS